MTELDDLLGDPGGWDNLLADTGNWWDDLKSGKAKRRTPTPEQAREAGKRDADEVISLARNAPDLAPWERIVSYEDYAEDRGLIEKTYTGPEHAPLLALLNADAYGAFLSGAAVFDAYADAFENLLKEADVRPVNTIADPTLDGERFISIYAVDTSRRPRFNPKGVMENGLIIETYLHQAFAPARLSWLPWRR